MVAEFKSFLVWLEAFLWSTPLILFILATGIFIFVSTRFFVIRYFGHTMKHTLGTLAGKQEKTAREGYISPFEAVCISIGGCMGAGSIAGVATAVAIGGPGAAFWLCLYGFLAMAVKLCEASLGCYYRNKDEQGHFTGGPMWYMEKGIGREMGKKVGYVLAMVFCVGTLCICLQGSQIYTISEVLNSVYGTDMILVTVIYTVLIYIFIWRGLPRVAKLASRLVPFMCVLFLLGGFGIILVNIDRLPQAIMLICHDAFTGSAAVGGFAGASVITALGSGLSRSIYANEAGQGTSAFAHSTADTVHPIRQGLWGSFEAFMGTIVVCNISALTIVITGLWESGKAGGTLSYLAYHTVYGVWGGYLLSIILILFGLTTTTGWYVYYTMVIEYFFRKHPIARDRSVFAFKLIFPSINIVVVSYISLTGSGPELFWTLVSIIQVPGILFNLLALVMLRGKLAVLFKDYKARHMGIGKVDPDFHIFYEDDPKVYAEEEAIRAELRRISGK